MYLQVVHMQRGEVPNSAREAIGENFTKKEILS